MRTKMVFFLLVLLNKYGKLKKVKLKRTVLLSILITILNNCHYLLQLTWNLLILSLRFFEKSCWQFCFFPLAENSRNDKACEMTIKSTDLKSGHFDLRGLQNWKANCTIRFEGREPEIVHLSLFNYVLKWVAF